MSFLDKFFQKSSPSVLGIDIGSSAIKIVQIRKKGAQAVLDTYGELALGPYSNASIGQAVVLTPERVAEALSDLMKEKEVNVQTKDCGLSIPFASSLMSVIEMPAVSRKQMEIMVPIEARKYIPVPINEVQLDWYVIPKNQLQPGEPEEHAQPEPHTTADAPLGKSEVFVVAIHNDTLERYKTIVEKTGLDAKFFEIELFSTMRAVVDESIKPVMILDIGAASTKVYIVERGIVKSSHAITRGSQDITKMISQSLGVPVDKAEVMKRETGASGQDQSLTGIIKLSLDHIFGEAQRTLLAYEKKYNKSVAKVILVGGGATLKGLAPLAQESFKTETVLADPFSKLSAPAFLEPVLKQAGPEFAVAIGLALRRLSEME